MTTERDYYDILGVSKTASAAEIKKAYRQKALEWHPDRNKSAEAEEKFKEVNEAYEVLTNPQKKEAYDRFGHAAFQQGGGASASNPFSGYQQGPFTYTYSNTNSGGEGFDFGGFSDPFEIFEQFFGGGSPFGRAQQSMPRYGLTLEFLEAARGVEKQVVIEGKRKTIKIPAGVDEGSRIRFQDFYITVDIQPDPVFQREGSDVYVNKEISLKMAMLGGTVEVPTIEGEIKIRIRPGTQAGTMVRLRGRGIKRLQSSGRGDEYVRLVINIPEKLTSEQKRAAELFD